MLALPDLVVGAAGRHRAVTVLPLFAPIAGHPIAYRLGSQAVAEGALEIHEVGAGAVDRLIARNRSADRVLLLEGDHLTGAKQNRVLTSSALIGARRKVALPVSCVERGRWSPDPSGFATSSSFASAGVRRILKLSVTRSLLDRRDRAADQSWVWSEIAEQQRRLHVSSATSALAHSYASRAGDLGTAARRLPYVANASGLAIGIGDELVSLDLFDKPATCAFYWRRLVEGAVLDALGRRVGGGIGATEVHQVVGQIRAAAWTPVLPVADGEELRARTADISASALLVDRRLVHFGLATGLASGSSVPLQSSRRLMRRELPDVLASRYTVVARVGVGSAKEVFHATDLRDGKSVAIARVPGVDGEMFAREVELLRRVRSRHVPEIYDSFVDSYEDGYIVMEYCDGKNLAQLADRPLAVADAGPILVELARGIAAIHGAHVLHRDIKPENVVLCSRGDQLELKILDFGLSGRAQTANTAVGPVDLVGTLPYLAQEVLRGDPIDARSDVYAFAACCFRLLVGEVPLAPADGESMFDYLLRLRDLPRHDLSRLPALPPPAGELLARMLDRDARRRPFMPEVVAGFERAFGTGAIPARRRTASAPPARALVRSHQLEVPIAAPDRLVVAPCQQAALIALVADGEGTAVRAIAADGSTRWSRGVAAALTTGLRADLDGDGVREVYLAGPDRLVALDAAGAPRFDVPAPPGAPSLLAIPHAVHPRLALDGRLLDPRTAADTGAIPYIYEGNGRQLVAATDLRGVSYDGFAMQAFRGRTRPPPRSSRTPVRASSASPTWRSASGESSW